jgi:flagella basal body P-ring formation protein FlgA
MQMRLYVACALVCASATAVAEPMPSSLRTAQETLHARLQEAYPHVTSWTLVPLLNERQMAAADASADVAVDAVKLGKRSALQVSWVEGERRLRQVLWFSVTGEQPGSLVNVDVPRNELIPVASVQADERAPWEPSCEALVPGTSLDGMRARKALRAGDLLCAGDMEPKPPVSRGEQVVVHSSAGLVTVVSKGIAEQDGAIGDRLRVRNPSSGEHYLALVTAEGEVVVRQ